MRNQNSLAHKWSIPSISNFSGVLFVLAVVQHVQARGNVYCYNVLVVGTFGVEYFEHDRSVDLVVGNKNTIGGLVALAACLVGTVLVVLVGDK